MSKKRVQRKKNPLRAIKRESWAPQNLTANTPYQHNPSAPASTRRLTLISERLDKMLKRLHNTVALTELQTQGFERKILAFQDLLDDAVEAGTNPFDPQLIATIDQIENFCIMLNETLPGAIEA